MDVLLSRVLAVRMEMSIVIAFCFHPRRIDVSRSYGTPTRTVIEIIGMCILTMMDCSQLWGVRVVGKTCTCPQSLPHCTQSNNLAINRSALYNAKCEGYNAPPRP